MQKSGDLIAHIGELSSSDLKAFKQKFIKLIE